MTTSIGFFFNLLMVLTTGNSNNMYSDNNGPLQGVGVQIYLSLVTTVVPSNSSQFLCQRYFTSISIYNFFDLLFNLNPKLLKNDFY